MPVIEIKFKDLLLYFSTEDSSVLIVHEDEPVGVSMSLEDLREIVDLIEKTRSSVNHAVS